MTKSKDKKPTDKGRLSRLPKREKRLFVENFLPIAAVISMALMASAFPQLIGAETILDYVKAFLLAVLAGGVAYGINRLAIDYGARQAAIGTPFALALSLSTILSVGFGAALATFGGLVINQTETLKLGAFAERNSAFIAHNLSSAETSAQILPFLLAIGTDLEAKAASEESQGSLSGTGIGGKGQTWAAIDAQRQRAVAMADAVAELERTRDVAAAQLSGLQSDFHATIANEALSASERRIRLQDTRAAIEREIGRLQQSVPDAAVAAYARDLQQGALINGNANATTHFSSILAGHGRALESVLRKAGEDAVPAPAFPARAGVSDTLLYVGFFAPLAIIVLVAEVAFPAALWLYTYFGFLARVREAK